MSLDFIKYEGLFAKQTVSRAISLCYFLCLHKKVTIKKVSKNSYFYYLRFLSFQHSSFRHSRAGRYPSSFIFHKNEIPAFLANKETKKAKEAYFASFLSRPASHHLLTS
ncbi:MAG: hypothetical protein LBG21_06810, partial [Campylobacteraceae bacterium]|nr:hypothetical protein [Campylobacteraceae bacterium]